MSAKRIDRSRKDAERFAFIEANGIKCGKRENGYWKAENEIYWVSRKTLAECIDVLMSNSSGVNAG